jgi:hypothetical protein
VNRHAKASSAGSTQRPGGSLGRIVRGAFSRRGASSDAKGSGAPSHRNPRPVIGLLFAALLVLVFAPSAIAVTTRAKVATFGTDGTSATSFGFDSPSQLTYNQANDKLYVLDKSGPKIHAFSAPALSLFGSPFPITVASTFGEPDIASDNTVSPSPTAANLYYSSESTGTVYGYDSAGAALSSPFPISPSEPKDLIGLGVDPSGNIWVGDYSAGKVRKYDPATGNEIGSVDTSGMGVGLPAQPAFDSNGDMFLSFYSGPTYKFTASSGYNPASATQIDSAATRGVTVDRSAHRVYVVHSDKVSAYDSAGILLYEFAKGISGESLSGVAVDEGTDTVYVSDAGNHKVYAYSAAQNFADASAILNPPANVTGTSAELSAKITDNNVLPTSWRLELSEDGGTSWSIVSSGQTAGSQVNAVVSGTATGLTPNSPSPAYRFRVVTNKGNGAADVLSNEVVFGSLSVPPLVSEVGAVEVEDTSARLVGTIDPSNSETDYVFEYGTTPALGSSTAPLAIGGGTTPIVASQPITGLAKDTIYYFRLTATNIFGSTPSTQATLHTRAQASPLPDGRAYEQVSPVDKNFGDAVPGTAAQLPRTNAVPYDGQSVAYGSVNSFGEPPGQILRNQAQYDSRRGDDGWRTQTVFPPTCNNDVSNPALFFFWITLSAGISANGQHATISQREASNCETPPLDSAAPLPATNLYRVNFDENPTTYDLLAPNFDTPPSNQVINSVPGLYVAGSDDFSRIYYGTVKQRGIFNVIDGFSGFEKIYEWHDGALTLASVDPSGNPFTEGSSVGPPGELQKGLTDTVNSVSANGERLFFMNPINFEGSSEIDVYMREAGAATYDVSESECTVECGHELAAAFEWADKEGDEALFSSPEKLVNSDEPNPGRVTVSRDLYAYRQSPNPTAEPNLTLVSQDNEPSDGTESKFKKVLGMADDGSTVFFTADSQLVPQAPAAPGTKVYRWSWNEGAPTLQYLATASLDEQGFYKNYEVDNWERRVSQPGDALMYETSARINPVADHDSDIDVYLWREGHGWSCVSCQAPGVPSSGPSTTSKVGQTLTTLSLAEHPLITKLSSAISEDGERVFFITPDSLVPADTNGPCSFDSDVGYYPCSDVYEWHDGRLSLITPGTASADTGLIGVSAAGNDVFFYTRQPLVGWDRDNFIDVYDARVDGGFPEPPAQPAECEGEACREQGSGTPANTGAGTAVFQGPGNPPPKHGKKHGKKHRKHHKRGRAHNRNANHHRRAGR